MEKFPNRISYIGGSDFSTVLDINPYKKRIELVLEKAGIITSTFEGNEATKRGEELENNIIELFENITGIKVGYKQQEFELIQDNCINLKCHVDGITSNNYVFEAKTTDIKSKTWNEGIPEYYKAQLEFNCLLAKKEKAYIAVGHCNGNKIEKFDFYEYVPQMTRKEIIKKCVEFTKDVEYYKKTQSVINNGIIIQSNLQDSLIEELEILNEKIKEINQQTKVYEIRKKEIEEQIKKEIGINRGIETNCYKITMGNRITMPSFDYKISRSNIKVEVK